MSGAERMKQLAGIMDMPGFPKSSGMRVVSAEPGKVTMALAKRPELCQFFGHFHGGVISALADHAAGACATSSMPEGKIAVTIEIKINFLAPADGEEMIARAETIQAGSTIGVIKVEVVSLKAGAERTCAFATATMRALGFAGRHALRNPAGWRTAEKSWPHAGQAPG